MSVTVETVTPVTPSAPAPVHPEAAKRAQGLAAGKAQPKGAAKEAKDALRNTVVSAVRAIIGDEAKTHLAQLDLKAQQLARFQGIVRPFETLGKLTSAQLEAFRDDAAKIFLVDISSRNPDAKKAAKNASVQATYLFNAMLAASQGFTVDVAMAEPYNVKHWTGYHTEAVKYLADAKNGATIDAPTPQRKGAATRKDNLETNKTPPKPKLDKVTVAELTAAKVPAEEQRTFLEQCANKSRLASCILYLTDNDMPKSRMWAIALLDHAEEVDEAIKSIVAPKAKTTRRFK